MRGFRKIINIIILFLLVVVQVSFATQLSQYGISMDIVLVAVIAITLREGLYYGMFCGFFAGMIFDLLSQHIVGTSALLYAVIAFLVVKLMESGFKKVITAYIFIVFAATELHIIIFNLIYYLFNFNISMVAFSLEIIIKPVMNIILLFLIFPLIGVVIPGEDYFEYKYKKKT